MTGRAVVREGSCPSVQNGRADVREGRYPVGQVSGILIEAVFTFLLGAW